MGFNHGRVLHGSCVTDSNVCRVSRDLRCNHLPRQGIPLGHSPSKTLICRRVSATCSQFGRSKLGMARIGQ